MITSINILQSGAYEVAVFLRDGNGYGRWRGLRCFESQGDARLFSFSDVPKFTDSELSQFSRTYLVGKIYRRIGFKKYYTIKE